MFNTDPNTQRCGAICSYASLTGTGLKQKAHQVTVSFLRCHEQGGGAADVDTVAVRTSVPLVFQNYLKSVSKKEILLKKNPHKKGTMYPKPYKPCRTSKGISLYIYI